MAGRKGNFDDAAKNKMIALLNEGMKPTMIARRFNINVSAVVNILQKAGVREPVRKKRPVEEMEKETC